MTLVAVVTGIFWRVSFGFGLCLGKSSTSSGGLYVFFFFVLRVGVFFFLGFPQRACHFKGFFVGNSPLDAYFSNELEPSGRQFFFVFYEIK